MADTVVKKFILSDSDFYFFVTDGIRRIRELLADFVDYGVTEEKLNILEQKFLEYDALPVNNSEDARLSVHLHNKEMKKQSLLGDILKMEVRLSAKYGKKSIVFEQFGMKSRYTFSDEVLESKSRASYFVLSDHKTELLDYGLTDLVLQDYLNKINDFADARITWLDARASRLKNTNNRINLANEIYKEMQKYYTFGRLIYKFKDKELYNRFVTYGSSKSYKLLPPSNLSLDNTEIIINWDSSANATSYQLWRMNDENKWVEIYSGDQTSFKLSELPLKDTKFKVRARNLKGFGPFSEEYEYKLES